MHVGRGMPNKVSYRPPDMIDHRTLDDIRSDQMKLCKSKKTNLPQHWIRQMIPPVERVIRWVGDHHSKISW